MQIDQSVMRDILVQQKKKYIRLGEVMDTTVQLAEALSRDDDVSVSMLIAMRQEPMLELGEIERIVRDQLARLPEEQAARVTGLLSGRGKVTPAPEECELDEVCKKNFRLLTRIVELDKPLNRKIGKDKAYYKDEKPRRPVSLNRG